MKTALKKLTTIPLWALPALLAVYVLAKLADFAWYRTQIPVGFQDANWSGKWESEVHGSIGGRLLVRLPDPIPENEDFKAEALVYYPVYSLWKTGQFVKMDFTGNLSTDSSTSGGQTSKPIPGKLSFKGKIGDQTVDYVAIVNENRTRIVGGYLSRQPNDYGVFWIKYDWTNDH
jgi:hypothetical protein